MEPTTLYLLSYFTRKALRPRGGIID